MNLHGCDKAKKRRPQDCGGEVMSVICGCGRTYQRCIEHEGAIGGHRSLRAHRAISINIACKLEPRVLRAQPDCGGGG